MSKISIIIPIYNGASWINQCFNSIIQQKQSDFSIEICVCNDSSIDNTIHLLNSWIDTLYNYNINLKIYDCHENQPKGVGFAKNKAISISTGDYLCFQDIDDIMLPERIIKQYEKIKLLKNSNFVIIGSQFYRKPENSTKRFTKWANSLTDEQLNIQIYTSHGPTIIMPTWFCHKSVFEKVGGFSEDGSGIPEDLIFFYKFLELGGKIYRIDEPLLIYTYHPKATTFSINKETIWKIRLAKLENCILDKWNTFTIWNAGKQGKKFYKSLTLKNQQKVEAFCDIDFKKIGRNYIPYNKELRHTDKPIKIIHFKDARAPFVICVKIDLTNGEFEKNLQALNLKENIDYVLFS